MRTLRTPAILLSMTLAGCATQAIAQGVVPETRVSNGPTSSQPPDILAGQSLWVARQPTPEDPGVVTGITLGELYTNNLKLAGPGQPKEGSLITAIQPFLKSAYSSPRLSGIFDLQLSGYLYTGHLNQQQLAEDLDASGTLTIVPQHLFLAGTATYGREVINHELPSGAATFFLNNNSANVGAATLSPYWVQSLGPVGTMRLRYTRGRVVYNRNGIPDASGNRLEGISNVTSNGVDFSIVSPKYDYWGWSLSYVAQHLKTDSGRELKFATATLGASRQLGIHLRLLANVGKENRFSPDGTVTVLGARFWNVGFEWSNARNDFKLLGGHRFYGHSAQLSWVHHAALLTTRVSYEERPTDLSQQLLGATPGVNLHLPRGISGVPSLFEHRIYLMKRAMASATYEMATGKLSVRLFDESRDYFLRGSRHEDVADAQLSWQFNLGPFTRITPTLGWRRYRFQDAQVNYTRYAQVKLVHQVNPSNFFSVQLRHDSRDTHAGRRAAHGYRVGVIYFKWTHLFSGVY